MKELRTLDPLKPVIILTGAGTPEAEQQAQALGVTEFVEKEFSLHRLGDSLKRLLNGSIPTETQRDHPSDLRAQVEGVLVSRGCAWCPQLSLLDEWDIRFGQSQWDAEGRPESGPEPHG